MKTLIFSIMMAMIHIFNINADLACPKFPTSDLTKFPEFSYIKNKSSNRTDLREAKVIIQNFKLEYERFRKDIQKYKKSLVYFDCVSEESSTHLISYESPMLTDDEILSLVTYIKFKSSLYSVIEFINEFHDYVDNYWEYVDALDELL